MTGAVERPIGKQLSTNFAGLMYRDGNSLKFVHSISGEGDERVQVALLSLKVSIVYKYDEPGSFNEMKLTVMNQYGSTSRMIPVDFDPLGPGGLAWYIILVIAFGSLVVVGVVVFFVIKWRRRKVRNEILLLPSQAGSDYI